MKPVRGQRVGWAVVMVLGAGCIDVGSLRPPPDGGSAPPTATGGSGGVAAPGTGGEAVRAVSSSGGTAGTYQGPRSSFAVADFDRDGTNEGIAVDNVTGKARIFEADGPPDGTELSGRFLGRVALGDLDGDGFTDVAYISSAPGSPIQITVLLNNQRSGGLGLPRTYDMVGLRAGEISPFLVALDVDGDGNLDLQVTGNGIGVMINSGRGIFLETIRDISKEIGGGRFMGCPGCAIDLPVSGE